MRVAGRALCAAAMSAASLAVGGCDDYQTCELGDINGAITVSPDNGHTAWSLERATATASMHFAPHATESTCPREVHSDAQIYPAGRSAWAVTGDALWWLSPLCDKSHEVLAGNPDLYGQSAPDTAVALDDDQIALLVISAAPPADKANVQRRVYLVSREGVDATRIPLDFVSEVPGRAGALPIIDNLREDPLHMRLSLDRRWLWIAGGDQLCRLEVASLRTRSSTDWKQCKGRTFPGKKIRDLSRSASTEPLWIATNGGAFSWWPGKEPLFHNIGPVRSIDRSPDAPGVAWALTDNGNLVRLDAGGAPYSWRRLPGSGFDRVRAAAGRVLLIGGGSLVACRNCATADTSAFEGDTLASRSFTDVADGPGGTLWLSASDRSALCTLGVHRSWAWTWVPLGLVIAAALALAIRHRLRTVRSRPKRTKHTIVLLAANPSGTGPLKLDEEARAIRIKLKHSDWLDLEFWGAARSYDLLDALRDLAPTVVHFSGHGGPGSAEDGIRHESEGRDIVPAHGAGPQAGLFFVADDGRSQLVPAEALVATFRSVHFRVALVVLSACYSKALAKALCEHVDCVIGMNGVIGDGAARKFSVEFYGGLAAGASIAEAFRQGCAAISLEGLRDADKPQLDSRAGVDPEKVILRAGKRARSARTPRVVTPAA